MVFPASMCAAIPNVRIFSRSDRLAWGMSQFGSGRGGERAGEAPGVAIEELGGIAIRGEEVVAPIPRITDATSKRFDAREPERGILAVLRATGVGGLDTSRERAEDEIPAQVTQQNREVAP